MKKTIYMLSAIAFQLPALSTTSYKVVAQNPPDAPQPIIIEQKAPTTPQPRAIEQKAPTTPQPRAIEQKAPTTPQRRIIDQKAPTTPQQTTAQRICATDSSIEDLLPPPAGEDINSPLSYLEQQGFTQDEDGSWVCYVSDAKKQGRYYTLFKVQEVKGKLVATSFLDQGSLGQGQDNRSLDFFMALIEKHTKTKQGNRQSIRRYLDAFLSLVKQGKIQPSNRGYLFDQPNRGFVIYHALNSAKLQGTAITINIDIACQSGSCPTS